MFSAPSRRSQSWLAFKTRFLAARASSRGSRRNPISFDRLGDRPPSFKNESPHRVWPDSITTRCVRACVENGPDVDESGNREESGSYHYVADNKGRIVFDVADLCDSLRGPPHLVDKKTIVLPFAYSWGRVGGGQYVPRIALGVVFTPAVAAGRSATIEALEVSVRNENSYRVGWIRSVVDVSRTPRAYVRDQSNPELFSPVRTRSGRRSTSWPRWS